MPKLANFKEKNNIQQRKQERKRMNIMIVVWFCIFVPGDLMYLYILGHMKLPHRQWSCKYTMQE